jgi:hypothetical protein
MNITLSADKELISKCRRYAKEHNTTINQLVRDFLQKTVGSQEPAESAEEFAALAKNMSGKSPKGFRFSRESLYDRNAER